jgi:exonuclease SbcC
VEKKRNTIEDNYRKVIIAELVSQLKENEPCPICGSKHHPQPATVEALSHHDLQQIIKKRNQIREKLEKLDQQICESEEAQAKLDKEIDSLTK